MRCRRCDYPLWNLAARACPECGEAFAPSDYQFKPNSVEFRCPHCAQPYYGTDADGHLTPRAFTCVTCHTPVDMDEMVLVVAPGIDPERAIKDVHPWIDRAREGRLRAWWKTSLLGMIYPVQLARVTPVDASLWSAWKFAALNFLLVIALTYLLIVAFGFLGVLMVAGAQGGGPRAGSIMLAVVGIYGAVFAAILVFQLVFTAIWILITHAFLRLTGGAEHTLRATALSILYTSGAYLPNLIPCVNYVSWLWWPITAGIMLKDMQRVSTWRAIFATLLAPILTAAAIVLTYTAFVAWAFSMQNAAVAPGATSARASASGAQMSIAIWSALNTHADATGAYPKHALLTLANGDLQPDTLIHSRTRTALPDIPAGNFTLDVFEYFTPEARRKLAQDVADAMPDDAVAHRLGDVVFTYHGFNPGADPNLWVAIITPDPDANPGQSEISALIWSSLASGSVETFHAEQFEQALQRQNTRRATHGLPPLPHPSDVHAGLPARATAPPPPSP